MALVDWNTKLIKWQAKKTHKEEILASLFLLTPNDKGRKEQIIVATWTDQIRSEKRKRERKCLLRCFFWIWTTKKKKLVIVATWTNQITSKKKTRKKPDTHTEKKCGVRCFFWRWKNLVILATWTDQITSPKTKKTKNKTGEILASLFLTTPYEIKRQMSQGCWTGRASRGQGSLSGGRAYTWVQRADAISTRGLGAPQGPQQLTPFRQP